MLAQKEEYSRQAGPATGQKHGQSPKKRAPEMLSTTLLLKESIFGLRNRKIADRNASSKLKDNNRNFFINKGTTSPI